MLPSTEDAHRDLIVSYAVASRQDRGLWGWGRISWTIGEDWSSPCHEEELNEHPSRMTRGLHILFSFVHGIVLSCQLEAWHCCRYRSHAVVSDSLQPHGLQPTRLLCPWDFPARVLEWVAIFFSRGSSWPISPAWQKDSLPLSHLASCYYFYLDAKCGLKSCINASQFPPLYASNWDRP